MKQYWAAWNETTSPVMTEKLEAAPVEFTRVQGLGANKGEAEANFKLVLSAHNATKVQALDAARDVEAEILEDAKRELARLEAAKATYIARFQGDPLEALSWGEQMAETAANAEPARIVVGASARGFSPLECLRYCIDNASRDLLRDGFRGGSTSLFHNAVEAAKRSAAANIAQGYAMLRGYLHMDERRAKARKAMGLPEFQWVPPAGSDAAKDAEEKAAKAAAETSKA